MSLRLFAWRPFWRSLSSRAVAPGQADATIPSQTTARRQIVTWDRQQVADDIRRLIADTFCLELDEVRFGAHWLTDLAGGDDSIDTLDFSFRLEKHFGMRFALMDELRGMFETVAVDDRGFLTQDALRQLRENYPFLELQTWETRPFTDARDLLTVGGLINFVLLRRDQAAESESSRKSSTV